MSRLFGPVFSALLLAGCDALDAETAALQPQVELAPPGAGRCPSCGWIVAKREIPPGAANLRAPQVYEYTVRMADGSSSVFQEALPASWRLGERLTVIAGTGPLN